MKTGGLKGAVESFGILAIVASLIFVGVQMRQDQAIAIAEIGQSSIDTTIQIDAAISEYADIWVKNNAGESLSEEENLIIKRIIHSLHVKRRVEVLMRRGMGQAGDVPAVLFAIFLFDNPGARRIWLLTSEVEVQRFLLRQ